MGDKDNWIEEKDGSRCPQCFALWDYCDNETEKFRYCPHCGARLGPENDPDWDALEEHRKAYLEGEVWN